MKMKKTNKYIMMAGIVIIAVAVVFAMSSSQTVSGNSIKQLVAKVPDGVYKSTESYQYPKGTNTIDISVGIRKGVIENISVSPVGTVDKWSEHYISGVNGALPSLVVGKRIDEVNLPKQISGSSLTTAAVDSYLHSIYA
jgi:hypothetical protein